LYALEFADLMKITVLIVAFSTPIIGLMVLQHYGYVKVFPFDSLDYIRDNWSQRETVAQETTPSQASSWWDDFFKNWVGLILFEKHDVYFFALGLLIGLISPSTLILSGLATLLTVRRIISGWISGLEAATILGAITLELLPLGTDLTLLPIVWSLLVMRTTLWLGLGAFISKFFVETFSSRGMFGLLFKIMGFIGLMLALADIFGFGVMGLKIKLGG